MSATLVIGAHGGTGDLAETPTYAHAVATGDAADLLLTVSPYRRMSFNLRRETGRRNVADLLARCIDLGIKIEWDIDGGNGSLRTLDALYEVIR